MISIIIPAFNEEKAIGSVIDEIHYVLAKHPCAYEIIVVDDHSTDNTHAIATSKNISVYRHNRNLGSGAARKTGLRQAHGDTIVMLDCDCTYPVKDIPLLLKHLPEYDQIIGARNKDYGSLRILRVFVKRLVSSFASLLTGTAIEDINSGLRAFKKDIAIKYMDLIPNGFSCVSTLTLIFICNKYKVKFIPIEYYKRTGKSKFIPLRDTFVFVISVLRTLIYFRFFSKTKKCPPDRMPRTI